MKRAIAAKHQVLAKSALESPQRRPARVDERRVEQRDARVRGLYEQPEHRAAEDDPPVPRARRGRR